MTGPVFEMPAAPTGRTYSSAHLIRIVDPLGEAIAWFAPELGACCAGYAVRQVKGASSEHVWWREIISASSVTRSSLSSPIRKDDGTAQSSWRFVERDPASCTMEWKEGNGPQAEHWQMVASLADARLSLSLRIWNTGTTPIQGGARLKLTLSSPPDIILRAAGPTPNNDPAEHGSVQSTRDHPGDGIMIAVEAAPGTSAIQTDQLGGDITCTVTYHQPDQSTPIIRRSQCQRLSVLIGLQMSGEGAGSWSLSRGLNVYLPRSPFPLNRYPKRRDSEPASLRARKAEGETANGFE